MDSSVTVIRLNELGTELLSYDRNFGPKFSGQRSIFSTRLISKKLLRLSTVLNVLALRMMRPIKLDKNDEGAREESRLVNPC